MAADARRVKELFVAALDLPDAEARRTFLDGACGEDADLRQRLDVLLQAHDDPASVLERPLAEVARAEPGSDAGGNRTPLTVDESSPPESAGTVIGPYKLLQQIGEGEMGTVFMAEQTHPFQR